GSCRSYCRLAEWCTCSCDGLASDITLLAGYGLCRRRRRTRNAIYPVGDSRLELAGGGGQARLWPVDRGRFDASRRHSFVIRWHVECHWVDRIVGCCTAPGCSISLWA